jgi:hypothetical protein
MAMAGGEKGVWTSTDYPRYNANRSISSCYDGLTIIIYNINIFIR